MPPPITGENICRSRLCDQLIENAGHVINARRFDREAWVGETKAVIVLPGQSWRGTVADVLLTVVWGWRGIPVYWYFHNRSWRRFAAVPAFVWNRVASIRPVMITGDLHKVFARKGMKSFLLRNAPEPLFQAASEPKSFKKRLVYVGRICRSKGFYAAIEVFQKLYDLDEQWTFDVYGSGDDVSEMLAPYGRAVTLHGWTNGEQKRAGYQAGGIVLFPSQYRNETSPMVIIEALSQGVPIVAYDVGGIAEMLRNGRRMGGLALRKSDQNVDGIIAGIHMIAQHYESYSRDALTLFTELFGPERYARQVTELFSEFLPQRAAPPVSREGLLAPTAIVADSAMKVSSRTR